MPMKPGFLRKVNDPLLMFVLPHELMVLQMHKLSEWEGYLATIFKDNFVVTNVECQRFCRLDCIILIYSSKGSSLRVLPSFSFFLLLNIVALV